MINAIHRVHKQIKKLQKEVSILKKALQFYADPDNYNPINGKSSISSVEFEKGREARKALAQIEKMKGE